VKYVPQNYSKSINSYQEALKFIPGGVNSPVRAFKAVGGQPIFMEKGEGAFLYDIDGNQYIDYLGGWGSLILGHRHPGVISALEEALKKGTSFGTPTELETALA
jgi:glutamate-1-semialdehyde 2,1-aminomutase